MDKEELYILGEDKQAARARIEQLGKEIQDLGPGFYDAFTQTSETWHDNAPFEALRDKQAVLFAEQQSLKAILSNAAISLPPQKKNTIGIGSRVTLCAANGKETTYFIAGDWASRTGEVVDDALVVSAKAPIARAMIGKRVGETVYFRADLKVLSVESRL